MKQENAAEMRVPKVRDCSRLRTFIFADRGNFSIFATLLQTRKIDKIQYKIYETMGNKLQELTEKLYGEGLEKGRAEGERLVAEAKAEAARILSEAKSEAENIVKTAERKAEDVEKNTMTEISLAGKQAVAKIKSEIADMIIAKSTSDAVKGASLDAAFVKDMLLEVARNWNGRDAAKIELKALLPESRRAEFDAAFEHSAKELLAAGIEVGYSAGVKNGFKVGAKNGGYYISFSDESFDALLKEYLRDKVSEMLYKA